MNNCGNVQVQARSNDGIDTYLPADTVHYLSRAEDANGYPSMDFEDWYQQGMACFNARLPKSLRKQTLHAQIKRWTAIGRHVDHWMIRAFAYGAAGRVGACDAANRP